MDRDKDVLVLRLSVKGEVDTLLSRIGHDGDVISTSAKVRDRF